MVPLALASAAVAFWLTRPGSRAAARVQAGRQFESALVAAVAQLGSRTSAPSWAAPRLPYSVMACVWSHRLGGSEAHSVYGANRDYVATLRAVNWQYRPDSPYIIAAALLSLRDAGLITISVDAHSNAFNALSAVRVERTGLAVTFADLALVEGGLLMACEDLARKRFFKTTAPGIHQLVREFVKVGSNDSYKWVAGLALHQARDLGLFEPAAPKGGGKPSYWLEHLALCDEQVVAFARRWTEFATKEPEIEQRLLTEAAFALRTSSGG